ncbi:MAG: Stk1 family PASTA domain-containing Ser/Thr kinase [Lactobacillales bacterium]|jgi:serine/threonine-protein kinase|nr:Stk1 family PASTA domain-containing Ser/Thr kinase [Lactobacillales bacterium]
MIQIGKIFSQRYRILDSLGSGGMANVFLAHDLILARDVAVKVLRFNFQNDPTAIRRFQREALATTELIHPNIVQIYDVGEEEGVQYLVMEYVCGMDLKKYIKQNFPISNEEIVRIMHEVLAGVAVAHDNRIIHRDLKPQNILISKDGQVKITDFGIAIAISETSITQTNSMLGSVHYLSPEQARGNKATNLSDIYALGIVLYEMMTGQVPFDGESAVTIALKHFQDELPFVREANPNIPQSLENVALIATAKDPVKRYSSALAMSEDLSTVLLPLRQNEPKVLLSKEKTIEVKPLPRKSVLENSKDIQSNQKRSDEQLLDKQIMNLYNKGKSPKKISAELLIPLEQVEKRLKALTRKRKVKYPRNNYKRYLLVGSAALAVLLILFFVLLSALPKDVDVPDLKNYTEKEARDKLEEKDLAVDKVIKVEDAQVEQGNVVKTNPKAHATTKAGRKITLYVSGGAKKITLKDYEGKTFEKAKEELTLQGYTSSLIVKQTQADDEVKEGKIINQSVGAGKKVNPARDKILFIVSSGSDSVTLGDDYIDSYLSEVKKDLIELGLKESQIKIMIDKNTGKQEGVVTRVRPNEGASVKKKTGKVTLYISDGKVEIPKGLKDEPEDDVKERLRKAGLDYKISREFSDDVPKGNVISVEPSTGPVAISTEIKLSISNGPKEESSSNNLSSSSTYSSSSQSSSSSSAGY